MEPVTIMLISVSVFFAMAAKDQYDASKFKRIKKKFFITSKQIARIN